MPGLIEKSGFVAKEMGAESSYIRRQDIFGCQLTTSALHATL